jgi:hypothetical protein
MEYIMSLIGTRAAWITRKKGQDWIVDTLLATTEAVGELMTIIIAYFQD